MAERDNWDKFEIVSKFIGTVILVLIPIVIKASADEIARSLERGKLVQTLIVDLTQRDTQARRDIALVALDAAVPHQQECTLFWIWGCKSQPEQDQVVQVAIVLLNDLVQDASQAGRPLLESKVAKEIIIRRTSEAYYSQTFNELSQAVQVQATSSANSDTRPTQSDVERQAVTSEIIATIQPSPAANSTTQNLSGVRLVYIQYQNNRERAEALQKYLQEKGISAPGIDRIPAINQNDIRYSNPADKPVAERLQADLQQNQGIQFDQLVNLSSTGYRVPSGQFEIWLKD